MFLKNTISDKSYELIKRIYKIACSKNLARRKGKNRGGEGFYSGLEF